MSYQEITFEQCDGVATLTLNRPQVLNALNSALLAEMLDALTRLAQAQSSRALVITGTGRAFSAGADLAEFAPEDAGAVLERFYNPLLEALLGLPLPVVAAINGPAVGAGCSIALASDFVVAARSAYFLQAFVAVGLVPDTGATWLLPRLVGRSRALEMMMLGERISSERALEWGLIHKCVDDSELPDLAMQLAARLAAGPTRTYRLIREGIRYALEHSLSETLHLERRHQTLAGCSADCAEAIAAFREKRPPAFGGK